MNCFVLLERTPANAAGLSGYPKNKTYNKKTNPKGSSFFQNDGVCVSDFSSV
ncbi:MAG: hypothetical protein NPMRTH1_50008 [Nitrosopumilales archaeon]|nr:MAG: hypothetical protein NPMRTH1_50008 [Nitrosopumilales archaeon]